MDEDIKFNPAAFKHSISEEDYDALEEEVTRNPPDVVAITGGFFTERAHRREAQTVQWTF